MAQYATVDDVQSLLPINVIIGTNALAEGTTVIEDDVISFIEFASNEIDSYISNVYRTPLLTYKKADLTTTIPTFTEDYPDPIRLVCARLAAGQLYDEVVNANQEPNISEWGQNIRNLGYDDLQRIASGQIILKGQTFSGQRFRRQELLDDPRLSRPGELSLPQRQAGK